MVTAAVVDPTADLLRRAVEDYQRAGQSGRDDDLLALRTWLLPVVEEGHAHDDLAMTLLQLHLDAHALDAAEQVLQAYPRAAATAAGRACAAVLAGQRGRYLEAGTAYVQLISEDPCWRHLAGLAGVFAELEEPDTADALFAEALDDVDALHMGAYAWIELRRAGLYRKGGATPLEPPAPRQQHTGARPDLERAEFHLRRAELAAPSWRTVEERTRWWLARDEPVASVGTAYELVAITGRPDHQHLLGTALARAGRKAQAATLFAEAHAGYRRAARVWPSRYRHHLVHWHLEVDHNLGRALDEALRDHAERPNLATTALLASVFEARGELREAERLREGGRRERWRQRQLLGHPSI